MLNISRMTVSKLRSILASTNDEELIEQIYDELDRRERDEEMRDHTEEDAQAAFSERYEMWRREY